MKVYLRKIPETEDEKSICDITGYVKKILRRNETLNIGKNGLRISDFTIEVINDNKMFSEISAGAFFPEGNCYNIPVYLVDENTASIIDAGIVKRIEENLETRIAKLVISSPILELKKHVICNYENITPPEIILYMFEYVDIKRVNINYASFEKAVSYYQGLSVAVDVKLEAKDKKNGFNIINEILDMTGDTIFLHNNVIHYYLNKEYQGNGGFNITDRDFIKAPVIKREDINNVITRVKYKLSDTTTLSFSIDEADENFTYISNAYKVHEHYKDYSSTKIKLGISTSSFIQIARNLLLKRGDRKLVANINLPLKYSFLRIGEVINLTIESRMLFGEPFEIIGRNIDYDNKTISLKIRDLNVYPKLIPELSFAPPKHVKNFSAWVKGTHLYIQWEKVTKDVHDNDIELSNYNVYYGAYSNFYENMYLKNVPLSPIQVNENCTAYEIWDLPKNTKIFLNITAISNVYSESSFTKEIKITTGNSGFGISPFGDNYGLS